MKQINRREFLKWSSMGLIAAVSPCSINQSESTANPVEEKLITQNSSAQVAAFRGQDLSQMTNILET